MPPVHSMGKRQWLHILLQDHKAMQTSQVFYSSADPDHRIMSVVQTRATSYNIDAHAYVCTRLTPLLDRLSPAVPLFSHPAPPLPLAYCLFPDYSCLDMETTSLCPPATAAALTCCLPDLPSSAAAGACVLPLPPPPPQQPPAHPGEPQPGCCPPERPHVCRMFIKGMPLACNLTGSTLKGHCDQMPQPGWGALTWRCRGRGV